VKKLLSSLFVAGLLLSSIGCGGGATTAPKADEAKKDAAKKDEAKKDAGDAKKDEAKKS